MTLAVDISAHGYGHLMQISPVVRKLAETLPADAIVVRCDLPQAIVTEALSSHSDLVPGPREVALQMSAPHLVDRETTLAACDAFLSNLDDLVQAEADALADLGATAVLSDVPFVGLLAAERLNIPSLAVCSLNWAEMFDHYLSDSPSGREMADIARRGYAAAEAFLIAAPRRSIPGLENGHTIGPLVRHWGRVRRDALRQQLGVDVETRVALVTFGGLRQSGPAVSVPQRPGWVFAFTGPVDEATAARPDVFDARTVGGFSFLDVLASSDLVVTKTGYSTFVECAYYGVPCLFLSRPDWPEAAELESFMAEHGYGAAADARVLADDSWLEAAVDAGWLNRDRPRLRDDDLGIAQAVSGVRGLMETNV